MRCTIGIDPKADATVFVLVDESFDLSATMRVTRYSNEPFMDYVDRVKADIDDFHLKFSSEGIWYRRDRSKSPIVGGGITGVTLFSSLKQYQRSRKEIEAAVLANTLWKSINQTDFDLVPVDLIPEALIDPLDYPKMIHSLPDLCVAYHIAITARLINDMENAAGDLFKLAGSE